jgi:hypothetical protein
LQQVRKQIVRQTRGFSGDLTSNGPQVDRNTIFV